MRKLEQQLLGDIKQAINIGDDYICENRATSPIMHKTYGNNTCLDASYHNVNNEQTEAIHVYLHNHAIYQYYYTYCNEFKEGKEYIVFSLCGFNTHTTKSRLNALFDTLDCTIKQINGQLYFYDYHHKVRYPINEGSNYRLIHGVLKDADSNSDLPVKQLA